MTDKAGPGRAQDHIHGALAEFLVELEHARADLVGVLYDVAPNDYYEATPTGDADVVKVGELVCGAHDEIDDCVADFDWVMRQAERRLREALR